MVLLLLSNSFRRHWTEIWK